MAEDFHDHAGVGSPFVEERGAGVAQVVEADLADAGVAAAPTFEHANRPGTVGIGVLIRASATGSPGMLSRLRGGPVFWLSALAVRAAPTNRRFGIS
ncbi:hypothetical protein ACWC4D_14410 [Streptomyces sp. NPDC001288]|uniref:hypothetical protein n=1 Tax=unclassified Streptomyces TaxID=2593676 RepID=UPI00333232BD